MSSNKTIGLILAIIGVIIAIAGLAVLLVENDLSETYAYALIIVGAVVAVIGILFMYFLGVPSGSNKEKAAKQKAPKAKKAPKAGKAAAKPVTKAASVAKLGDSELAKAIKFGAAKLDSKIEAGKVSDKDADLLFQRLMAFAPKVGTPEEDASMPLVSQVIGSIASA